MGMNIQIEEQWSYDIYVNFLNYAQFGLGVTLYTFGSILKNSQRLAVA